MKKTILFAAIISIFAFGCTKSPAGSGRTNYTCHCFWKKNPLKDTTAVFVYPGDTTQAAATAACNSRDTWVKSISGVSSGANCRLQ